MSAAVTKRFVRLGWALLGVVCVGLLAVGAIVWFVEADVQENCDRVTRAHDPALQAFADETARQGGEVVGPRCSNSDGNTVTVEAYFEAGDLPIEFGSLTFTQSDLDSDRRLCAPATGGAVIDVMQLGGAPFAIASGTSYALDCTG